VNAIEEGNANFDELAKKTESLTKAREGSMKEAAEQHSVLSCDSCEHAEKTNSRDYPVKCMVSKPVPMMVHNYCISWFGYVGCASHSSAVPASSEPAPDYRELFVADLISLIRWDANHGNPELFKAVHQIQHHYAKPFSQQLIEHDERIRQEERERVLDLLITFRKAQSRVYPLKVSWEEEGKYILELRGGEP
jgi:hypothetical protein